MGYVTTNLGRKAGRPGERQNRMRQARNVRLKKWLVLDETARRANSLR
jgi:hypothetical protein